MPQRIIICAKDVETIIGVRPRTARKILQDVRKQLAKDPKAYVTIRDFCKCMDIDEDLVRETMMF